MENENVKQRSPKQNQKQYEDLKHSGRHKRKKQMEAAFRDATNILHPEIKRVKVELEYENGNLMSFFPRKQEPQQNNALEWERKENDMRITAQKFLSIKDKYRISDEAMHELHMVQKIIPSKNQLQDERNRLNTVITIYPHREPLLDSATRKIQDVLSYVLQHPVNRHLMDVDADAEISLSLRFSCDGAKITKKLNSVRGVFKILQDRNKLPETVDQLSMSPEDELSLFFYIGEENRSALERHAVDTFKDMQTISNSGLEILGKKVQLKWIMACDWKAAALLKGINNARCDSFCLWCYCSKQQICDFTNDQNAAIATKSQGYIHDDMCQFIPYTSLVIDDLHLRIRISLKLFNQVVTWAIDQKAERKLEQELTRIRVSFHFWEERGEDKSNLSVKKWSQPSGDDLRTIIKQLQIYNVLERKQDRHLVTVGSLAVTQLRDELVNRSLSSKGSKAVLVARLQEALGNGIKIRRKSSRSRLQVSYDFQNDGNDDDDEDDDGMSLDIEALQQLWADFDVLMEALRELPSSETYIEPGRFKEMARQWAQNFRKYTFDEDVTPYIHALVYHVPYFLDKYKYLHDIGVSQVERKNYDHRQAYFDSTNRNGGKNRKKVSLQILQRENRLLWARYEGIERKKRQYKKQTGE